jgi:hypothetical protein
MLICSKSYKQITRKKAYLRTKKLNKDSIPAAA